MPICRKCKTEFPNHMVIDGKKRNLKNRKYCIECSPFGSKNRRKLEEVQTPKCIKCGDENPGNFYTRRGDRYYSYCKKCTTVVTSERQRKNKKDAVEYKGGRCCICGYDKCDASLDFHHLDPDAKEYTISHFHGRVIESLKEELDKCILVCRNCHGEIHAGIVEIPEDMP